MTLGVLAQGASLATSTIPAAAGTGYDGNNDYRLSVVDDRTVGADWQLLASLSPFTSGTATLKTAQLVLKDTTGVVDRTLSADGATQTVYTQTGYQGQTFDVTPSSLHLLATPLAAAGEYQSTITWTLAIVPTP